MGEATLRDLERDGLISGPIAKTTALKPCVVASTLERLSGVFIDMLLNPLAPADPEKCGRCGRVSLGLLGAENGERGVR